MARLNGPKRTTLTLEDLRQYPIWVWDETTEYLLPLAHDTESPRDFHPLFIAAKFRADGVEMDGYLIGAHAIGLCVGGQEVIINARMPETVRHGREIVQRAFGRFRLKLFPLQFESHVRLPNEPPITGTYDWR